MDMVGATHVSSCNNIIIIIVAKSVEPRFFCDSRRRLNELIILLYYNMIYVRLYTIPRHRRAIV